MFFRLAGAAVISAAVLSGPALACPWHGPGGFSGFGQGNWRTVHFNADGTPIVPARSDSAAEGADSRKAALDATRSRFLERFKVEPAPAPAETAEAPSAALPN